MANPIPAKTNEAKECSPPDNSKNTPAEKTLIASLISIVLFM